MKKRIPADAAPVIEIADDLLCEIVNLDETIKHFMDAYEAEKKRLDQSYAATLAPLENDREDAAKRLISLMKKKKDVIFRDGDIVYRPLGTLGHSISHPVAYPRSYDPVIALLEEKGYTDAVKVKKSLDKDMIEKWPDDRLADVGLERKPKEEFTYDLKKVQG